MDKLLKPIEAAQMLNMSRAALYKWVEKGLIRVVRLPSGKIRIQLSELNRVIAEANPSETKNTFFTFINEEKGGEA